MNYYHLIALLTINIGFTTIASENRNKPYNSNLSGRSSSLIKTNEYIKELITSKNTSEIAGYVQSIKKQTSRSLISAKELMNRLGGYPTLRNYILPDNIPYVSIARIGGAMIESMEAVKMLVVEQNPSLLPFLANAPYWENKNLTNHDFLNHYQQSINEATPGEFLKKLEQKQQLQKQQLQKQQLQKQQSMKFSIIVLALTMLAIVNYNKIIELLKRHIG